MDKQQKLSEVKYLIENLQLLEEISKLESKLNKRMAVISKIGAKI